MSKYDKKMHEKMRRIQPEGYSRNGEYIGLEEWRKERELEEKEIAEYRLHKIAIYKERLRLLKEKEASKESKLKIEYGDGVASVSVEESENN